MGVCTSLHLYVFLMLYLGPFFLFVIVLVCIVLFLCCCLFCNEKERKGIDVWEWEDGRIWDDLREGTMIRIYYIKKYTI